MIVIGAELRDLLPGTVEGRNDECFVLSSEASLTSPVTWPPLVVAVDLSRNTFHQA